MTKTLTALGSLSELRELTSGDNPTAWERVRELVAVVAAARESGGLADELREEASAKADVALVEMIREHLKETGYTDVVGVVFTTMDYDNGNFFNASSVTAYAEDGTTYDFLEFPSEVEDLLTDEYGAVGADAGFGMNVRTGATDFDDYVGNVYDAIGIKKPKSRGL